MSIKQICYFDMAYVISRSVGSRHREDYKRSYLQQTGAWVQRRVNTVVDDVIRAQPMQISLE